MGLARLGLTGTGVDRSIATHQPAREVHQPAQGQARSFAEQLELVLLVTAIRPGLVEGCRFPDEQFGWNGRSMAPEAQPAEDSRVVGGLKRRLR